VDKINAISHKNLFEIIKSLFASINSAKDIEDAFIIDKTKD
jgi:hypothetical protein